MYPVIINSRFTQPDPPPLEPIGGDLVADDLYSLLQIISTWPATNSIPKEGGALTLNGGSLGNYDYIVRREDVVIDSGNPFVASEWFTTNEDSHSALCVVDGNLTVGAGELMKPAVRKLFMGLYVTGSLTVDGEISMTARGANHSSATGSNITAVTIPIAVGTFSEVTNPEVPATGGAGAAQAGFAPGNNGTAGVDGGTGGGGGGGGRLGTGGAGAAGTAFTGGSGGGAGSKAGSIGEGAFANGGKGGDGNVGGTNTGAGGGAGNPGGTHSSGTGGSADDGEAGAGGILLLYCDGTFHGSGAFSADGSDGGGANATDDAGGGGSGGGVAVGLFGADLSSITPTANGGAGGAAVNQNADGGAGGAGTAQILIL